MQNEVILEINLFGFPWSSNKAALRPVAAAFPELRPIGVSGSSPDTKSLTCCCSDYLVTERSRGCFPIIRINGPVIMRRPASHGLNRLRLTSGLNR